MFVMMIEYDVNPKLQFPFCIVLSSFSCAPYYPEFTYTVPEFTLYNILSRVLLCITSSRVTFIYLVLAIEDDLFQFWCGNMVTLASMILCIGYLAYGMDFEQFYVIFSICCFQIKLILIVYTFSQYFGSIWCRKSGLISLI